MAPPGVQAGVARALALGEAVTPFNAKDVAKALWASACPHLDDAARAHCDECLATALQGAHENGQFIGRAEASGSWFEGWRAACRAARDLANMATLTVSVEAIHALEADYDVRRVDPRPAPDNLAPRGGPQTNDEVVKGVPLPAGLRTASPAPPLGVQEGGNCVYGHRLAGHVGCQADDCDCWSPAPDMLTVRTRSPDVSIKLESIDMGRPGGDATVRVYGRVNGDGTLTIERVETSTDEPGGDQ